MTDDIDEEDWTYGEPACAACGADEPEDCTCHDPGGEDE